MNPPQIFWTCSQTLAESRRLGFPGVINGSFNLVPLEAGRLFCLADPNCICADVDQKSNRKSEITRLQKKIDDLWAAITKHGLYNLRPCDVYNMHLYDF